MDPATQILARAEALFEELEPIERWLRKMNDVTRSVIRGQMDEPHFSEAYSRGRAMPLDEVIELAMEATSAGRSDETATPIPRPWAQATDARRE